MKSLFKDPAIFFLTLSVFVALTNYIGSMPQIIIFLLTDIFIIKKDGGAVLRRKSVRLLTFFYIILILYGLLGHGTLNAKTLRMTIYGILSLYSIYIMSFHIKTLSEKQIKYLLFVALFALSLSVGVTSYIGTINPMALRAYGFGEVEGFEAVEASVYQSAGMMTYSSAHAISVMATGLCIMSCYCSKKWVALFSLILMLLIIRLQFVMTITTAMLASVFGCMLILVNKFSKGKTLIALNVLIILVVLFFTTGMVADVLSYAGSTNTQISKKLSDLFLSVQSGETTGQMGYRDHLYSTSFNSFLANPIFGWAVDNGSRIYIGEHSFFIDYLAIFGLFSLFYFFAWWIEFKSLSSYLNIKKNNIYYFTILPAVMLIISKAPSVCSMLPFASMVFLQLIFIYVCKTAKNKL